MTRSERTLDTVTFRTREDQERAVFPQDGYTRTIFHITQYRAEILEAEARGAAAALAKLLRGGE